jgi:hypothetical protein
MKNPQNDKITCCALLDALCVLHAGWNDETEAIYREAQKLVWTHARKLKLERQLRDLNESASNAKLCNSPEAPDRE